MAAAVPEEHREVVIASHAVSHRMSRVFEAARSRSGEVAVDALYATWGPVMSPAPTGDAAVRFWDAIQVISREPGLFEITRPRTNPPRVTH